MQTKETKPVSTSFTREQVVAWMQGLDERDIAELAQEATKRKIGCLFKEAELVTTEMWHHHEELHQLLATKDADIAMLKKDKEQLMSDLRSRDARIAEVAEKYRALEAVVQHDRQVKAAPPIYPPAESLQGSLVRAISAGEKQIVQDAITICGSQAAFSRKSNGKAAASTLSRVMRDQPMTDYLIVTIVNEARTIVANKGA